MCACCRGWGDRLTNTLLFLDDLSDLALQPLLQLLVPVPHPPLEMQTFEASVSQPKLLETFCLVFETLSRLLVHGIFKQLLSSSGIVREDTTCEDDLAEVFTKDLKIERDFLLARVSGVDRRVWGVVLLLERYYSVGVMSKINGAYLRT